MAFGMRGNQFRQRRFARTRGTIQDDRPHPIGLQHSPQQLSFAQEVLLPGEFGERSRSHASGEWTDLVTRRLFLLIEQSHEPLLPG
jgi:hypothetical protein